MEIEKLLKQIKKAKTLEIAMTKTLENEPLLALLKEKGADIYILSGGPTIVLNHEGFAYYSMSSTQYALYNKNNLGELNEITGELKVFDNPLEHYIQRLEEDLRKIGTDRAN